MVISMSKYFEYKGYYATVDYSYTDKVLFGKIEGIQDLVNFESSDGNEVENAFHEAVDDYLAFCGEVGKNPNKPYKGSFNIRISPEMHKSLALEAFKCGKNLNQIVTEAFNQFLNQKCSWPCEEEKLDGSNQVAQVDIEQAATTPSWTN